MRNWRLRADPHETVGEVDRQPGMSPEFATASGGDGTVVSRVQFRAVVDENLNDFVSSLVRRPMQRRSSIVTLCIRIKPVPRITSASVISGIMRRRSPMGSMRSSQANICGSLSRHK